MHVLLVDPDRFAETSTGQQLMLTVVTMSFDQNTDVDVTVLKIYAQWGKYNDVKLERVGVDSALCNTFFQPRQLFQSKRSLFIDVLLKFKLSHPSLSKAR